MKKTIRTFALGALGLGVSVLANADSDITRPGINTTTPPAGTTSSPGITPSLDAPGMREDGSPSASPSTSPSTSDDAVGRVHRDPSSRDSSADDIRRADEMEQRGGVGEADRTRDPNTIPPYTDDIKNDPRRIQQ